MSVSTFGAEVVNAFLAKFVCRFSTDCQHAEIRNVREMNVREMNDRAVVKNTWVMELPRRWVGIRKRSERTKTSIHFKISRGYE